MAVPVLVVALAQLVMDAFLKGDADEGGKQRERIRDIEVDRSVPARLVARRAGGFYLSALGFLATILLIGFKPTVPLFLVLYLRLVSQAGWIVHAGPDRPADGAGARALRRHPACSVAGSSAGTRHREPAPLTHSLTLSTPSK